MCLVVFAWQTHPDYPLVLAANRDEFYARATRPAAWWGQRVALLSGRDEEAGGTWLGVNRQGRFAALTNVRAPHERNPQAPSRGTLVVAALQAPAPLGAWVGPLAASTRGYNGFNLLAGEMAAASPQLYYASNRRAEPAAPLAPGVYGLSNAALDTPWPKVTRTVGRFACELARDMNPERLLALMADRTVARDHELPATGVPLAWERALSAVQIRALGYGTRSSAVLAIRSDGLVRFVERSFDTTDPARYRDRDYEFLIDATAPHGTP